MWHYSVYIFLFSHISFPYELLISSWIIVMYKYPDTNATFKSSNLCAYVFTHACRSRGQDCRCPMSVVAFVALALGPPLFLVLSIFRPQADWRVHRVCLRDTFPTNATRRQWLLSKWHGAGRRRKYRFANWFTCVRARRSALTHFPLRTPPRMPSPAFDGKRAFANNRMRFTWISHKVYIFSGKKYFHQTDRWYFLSSLQYEPDAIFS